MTAKVRVLCTAALLGLAAQVPACTRKKALRRSESTSAR
jgi:hypothetical protein